MNQKINPFMRVSIAVLAIVCFAALPITTIARVNPAISRLEPANVVASDSVAASAWESLGKQLAAVAPKTSFVAAEVTDGICNPLQSVNADQELGIGSAFKLYVLGELAHQVEEGRADWDELLTLQQRLKSLPSGNMLYEPNGSKFALRFYAEQMIAESDNTATDHLINRLGRRNIEKMMVTMGHANPSLNVPLLMTREWFAIKLRFSSAELTNYLDASSATKRRILTSKVDSLADTLWDGEEWTSPYLIDKIEWFASATDLCNAMAYLHTMAQKPGLSPVQDTLSLNPEIVFDPSVWTYVGFKGGYETGVKSDTWLLRRIDGRWFAISAIINDPTQEINGYLLNSLMIPAARLLATTK